MADELKPDICVIGGGPGGIAVATAAANANVPVVLVEKGEIGGTELAAAVPSKALIAAANRYETLRSAPAVGVTGAPLQVNLGKVFDHVRAVMDAVAANSSAERLAALGVTVIRAEGRFTDRRTVVAGDATIRARRFVIATGAKPKAPDLPGLAGVDFMTLDTAFDGARKMTHLIVLGAGRRGLELAQAYNRLGVDTTVIDEQAALADDDPELAALVLSRLAAEGVRVRDSARIVGFARRRGGIRVTLGEGAAEDEDESEGEDADRIHVDGTHLLVATGSAPNVDGLGLPEAGIGNGPNGIKVDSRLRTTNPRVYAIGDVVAGPTAANRAEHHAHLVLKSVLYRLPIRDDVGAVPLIAFTDPALATVGLGEAAAREKHKTVRVLRLPMSENDLSQADRTTAGMLKVIVTQRGRILGAAAVGRDAGEIIGLWSLAIANRLGISAMQHFVPAYPSRLELSRRVAASFDGPGLTPPWRRRIIEMLRKFG
jgi:pyruvate/2-oxoglutarate dehydrogenase complex dihydrolipoamide dehydrogenase (E3) component